MDCLISEAVVRWLKFTPAILWSILAGAIEWFIPASWYAKKVDQEIVLITGAGSGLGRAIAVKYAKLNSSLVLWDINEQALEDTKALVEFEHLKNLEKSGSDAESAKERFCKIYLVDVSDKFKVKEAAERVHKDLNSDSKKSLSSLDQKEQYVSVLINNAGIYYGLMLQELRDEQIERIFNINVLAHFWTVRAFLPKMIEHEKGHIVEIASMGGIGGMLKQVDYCATKFATVGFEESLSIELDSMGLGDKIRTTLVCPFFFSSNLFTGFNSE